jgi:hypothetical protein
MLIFIMDKWPVGQFADPFFVIKVQQDGDGGHISYLDEYLNNTIEELGLPGKVEFYTQPATSIYWILDSSMLYKQSTTIPPLPTVWN